MPQLTELELLDHIDPSRLDYQDCNFNYCVYKHTATNGKVYIGITNNDPKKRWDSGHGYYRQAHFWNAIQKYGWKNIEHEIIFSGLTREEAFQFEIKLIKQYDSSNPQKGYNLSTGGKGGSTGTILSQETRLKMSKSRTGTKHPMYGKHHTDDTKKKISEKFSGENHPQFGTHRSAETKMKLRCANSGENHPLYGKHLPLSTRQKIKENNGKSKPVLCVETGITYMSASEASRQCGISNCHISECCRNAPNRKTAGGYHWKRIGESNERK